jgi:hypothetical protein
MLLCLLQLRSQLVNAFLLSVLDLVSFPQVALGHLDRVGLLVAVVFCPLNVRLQLRHFDFSLVDHAACLDNSAVDSRALMRQVFVAMLEVLNILLEDRDLTILVVHLCFIVQAHGANAIFQQIAPLLHVRDLDPECLVFSV